MMKNLEHYCSQLPGATFDLKWGNDRTYCVAEKMFAVFCSDKTSESTKLSIKVSPADFLALTELDGVEPAPYLARHHWIAIDSQAALSESELENLVQGSYDNVFSKLSKKKQQAIVTLSHD